MIKGINNKKVIVFGEGGHASVLIDLLQLLDIKDILICTNDIKQNKKRYSSYEYINESELTPEKYTHDETYLVNGLGSVNSLEKRIEIYSKFRQLAYSFMSLIHPFSYVSKSALLGEGVQVFAGAVLQTNSIISDNVIINTKVSIDHDCSISSHVHLAPGVNMSGGVTIGTGTHVGTGANIIQGVTIGDNCHIGAGCLITENIPSNSKVRKETGNKIIQQTK